MIKYILIFLISTICCADIPSRIKLDEGKSNVPYKDASGYSVGYGHHQKEKFKKKYYSDKEIESFFIADYNKAKISAQNLYNLDEHSEDVQYILISLCYQLGEGGASKFVKFKKNIDSKNYKKAAKELANSKLFKQTPNRVKKYILILNAQ